MTNQMVTIPQFPSKEHRLALLQKSYSARTTDELWFWHAYDYAWRRVALAEHEDISPIDPNKLWFDHALVLAAEIFWRRFFNRPADRESTRPDPTQEDIAHVERVCVLIRKNLDAWAARNSQAFAPKRRPMSDVQKQLGVSASQRVPEAAE